jgi:hypothetical protein
MVKNTVIVGLRPCLAAACDTVACRELATFRGSEKISRKESLGIPLSRGIAEGRSPDAGGYATR